MADSTVTHSQRLEALAQRILELRIQQTSRYGIAGLVPDLVDGVDDFPGEDGPDYETATDAVIEALGRGTIEIVFHPARDDRIVLDLRG